MVGQLIGTNREQIAFEGASSIKVRETIDEADKRFLNDVFADSTTANAAFDKRQQTTFVAGDQIIPRVTISAADSLNNDLICFWSGCHDKNAEEYRGVSLRERSVTHRAE